MRILKRFVKCSYCDAKVVRESTRDLATCWACKKKNRSVYNKLRYKDLEMKCPNCKTKLIRDKIYKIKKPDICGGYLLEDSFDGYICINCNFTIKI